MLLMYTRTCGMLLIAQRQASPFPCICESYHKGLHPAQEHPRDHESIGMLLALRMCLTMEMQLLHSEQATGACCWFR